MTGEFAMDIGQSVESLISLLSLTRLCGPAVRTQQGPDDKLLYFDPLPFSAVNLK